MKANTDGWFKDVDKEVEILKQQTKEMYYQSADGQFGEMDITSFIEKMETDYNKLKENIKNKYELEIDG